MNRLQNIALTLFCIAVSVSFIFMGLVALIFTLGVGFTWLAPLVLFLFGMSNLFFVLIAHTSTDRRAARTIAISSSIAIAALLVHGLFVSYGPEAVSMLFPCAMVGLNWLALRAIFDARLADANPSA